MCDRRDASTLGDFGLCSVAMAVLRCSYRSGFVRHTLSPGLRYFLKEEYEKLGLPPACKEFIHFGLTSQDVNNTAVPLAMKKVSLGVLTNSVADRTATLR